MKKLIFLLFLTLLGYFGYSQSPVTRSKIVEATEHLFNPTDTAIAPKRLGERRTVYVNGVAKDYRARALTGNHKWELDPDKEYIDSVAIKDTTIIFYDLPTGYIISTPGRDTVDVLLAQYVSDSAGIIRSLSFGNLSPLFTTSYNTTDPKNPTVSFSLSNAAQNAVLAGPTSGTGAPTYRALVAGDIPNLDASKITTGTIAAARLGSGTANSTTVLYGDGVYRTPTGGITSLTGDVTASGTGAVAATIANDVVTNAKMANMATQTLKGRNTTGTGDPEDLSTTTVKSMLSIGRGAEWEIVEDFYIGYLSNNFNLVNANGGTAGSWSIYADDQRGIARISTGNSSATAYAHLITHDNSFTFSSTTYSLDVKDIVLTDLNTTSDSTAYIIGFWDNIFSNGNPADGAYIAYVQTESTWRCVTTSNGTQTVTSTAVNVGTGIANSIDIEIRANSTSVEFFINGVSRATHTTNIPVGTTRAFSMGIGVKKKLGSAARTMDVDRILFKTL